jgi:hypothetical protein
MSMRALTLSLAFVFAVSLLSSPLSLQEKGGEDETGPYAVVENWPAPWAKPGYIWGSQPGIFAETPNRIFIAARGELKLPDTLPRGFNGIWGSMNQRATEPKPEMRNCIVIVDGNGKLIESWTQWDKLFEGGGGPHKIRISPYDPERHVWVVNDARHQIYEFTNDGKQLVRTLGEADVAGNDDKHFGRPQDIAWLPDGSLLVADGLGNSRVAKFDKNGVFIKSWGSRGNEPGQFGTARAIAVDAQNNVYVADPRNSRIQVFDSDGNLKRQITGVGAPQALCITPGPNQVLYSSNSNPPEDIDTAGEIYKLKLDGTVIGKFGRAGRLPKEFNFVNAIDCRTENGLLVGEIGNLRVQKIALH